MFGRINYRLPVVKVSRVRCGLRVKSERRVMRRRFVFQVSDAS